MNLKIGVLTIVAFCAVVLMLPSVNVAAAEAYCEETYITSSGEFLGITVNLWGGDNCKVCDIFSCECNYKVEDCLMHFYNYRGYDTCTGITYEKLIFC